MQKVGQAPRFSGLFLKRGGGVNWPAPQHPRPLALSSHWARGVSGLQGNRSLPKTTMASRLMATSQLTQELIWTRCPPARLPPRHFGTTAPRPSGVAQG
jgi:hypothetical protein